MTEQTIEQLRAELVQRDRKHKNNAKMIEVRGKELDKVRAELAQAREVAHKQREEALALGKEQQNLNRLLSKYTAGINVLQEQLTDACDARDALARECNKISSLVEERDTELAQRNLEHINDMKVMSGQGEELTQTHAELKNLRGANEALGQQMARLTRNRDFWYETALASEAERQEAQEQSDEVQSHWLSPCQKAGLEALAEGLRRQLADARRVARLWYRRAREPMVEVEIEGKEVIGALQAERKLRQEAELAAQVHDRSCGELAQTVRTERALRLDAEQYVNGLRQKIDGIRDALDECNVSRHYPNDAPASLRTRIFWLNQRAERAEALAALVTEETAALLERLAQMAEIGYGGTGCSEMKARKLAAQIREALDDKQA